MLQKTADRDSDSIEARIERARTQDFRADVVSSDPLVLQVTNEDNETVHTVVPNIAHCSCADHTYRKTLCKHLLYLLDGDDFLNEEVRRVVDEHQNELERHASTISENIRALEDDFEEVRAEIDQITVAKEELGLSHLSQEEATDIADLFDGVGDGATDGAEMEQEAEDDEDESEEDAFQAWLDGL